MNKHDPPKFAERFFSWFCHQAHLEGLEGDLYELFERRKHQQGHIKAKIYYLLDMISLLRSTVANPVKFKTQNVTMGILNNYLKSAFRQGWKRKGFSAINLFGLTMGITSVMFIMLFISDELKFDQNITNAEQKFRMYNIRYGEDGVVNYLPIVPPVFAPTLKDNFPQVEKAGRIIFNYLGTIFNVDDKTFSEKNGFFAEVETLEILDLELLEGDLSRMEEPMSVLLSQSTFRKFFGDVPFKDQTVKLTRRTLQVVGIFKDYPKQFHLNVDYIFPFKLAVGQVTEERMNSWGWQQFYTYVQFKPGTDVGEFTQQFRSYIEQKAKPITSESGFYYIPHLQAIRDIHLHSSNFEWDIAERGNYQSIVFLAIAAAIILLIACLNFINLTAALALKRAKEVCVRKFIGAKRSQLLIQYGMESSLYTLLAGGISFTLLILILPYFNNFTGKNFDIPTLLTLENIAIYSGTLLLLGILTGIYPAILLTSFKPLVVLHGASNISLNSGRAGIKINVRQIMVSLQYVLSIGLIIISLIIQKQYNFLQKTDMGFNKENLMVIPLTPSLKKDFNVTREAFKRYNGVKDISFSYGVPGGIVAGDGVFVPDKSDHELSANMFLVDHNYLKTMQLKLLAGRDFDENKITDISEAFIINETAVKNFGLNNPEEAIGEPINWPIWGEQDSLKKGNVIGVISDFNFKSLHNMMSSVVIHIGPSYFGSVILRIGEGDLQATIKHIESTYRTFETSRPFEFEFVDQTFQKFYESEQKLNLLFSLFTIIAIFTAAIGLFGLVSFSVASRAKEISIRKVLGASTNTIFTLVVQHYFIMVTVCLIIAFPAAYYFASRWLTNFAFRVDLDAWIFLQVALITALLTIFTVGFQAYRGAMANPSEKLKAE